MGAYVTKNPELAGKVGIVYLFKLTGPDTAWTLDLKNGKGAVTAGAPASADCTLELSDADFMAMCAGKADPQKLYFGGKLKISGNVMASQKLELLKKIDPNDVLAAMQKRTGGGGAPAPAAAPAASAKAAPAAPKGPSAKAIFDKLAARFAESSKLASELGAIVRFKVTDAGDFVVDGTGAGAVRSEGDATTTVTLDEEALAALVGGESPERLHQTGRMRVDGDVRVAARLGFMKGLA
jgi:3-hydroxyacyl-CoA dehydrogenase/3a,7a,12a-trihydroxy-5b-cholest-24-enoyl-CoA hydratase